MWTGHNLQLWESLFHIGRVGTWWWTAGDKQEKCAESYCSPGLTTRGQ